MKIALLILFLFTGGIPVIKRDAVKGTLYTEVVFDNDSTVVVNLLLTANDFDDDCKFKWVLDGTTFGDSVTFTPTSIPVPLSDLVTQMTNELRYFDSVNNVNVRFK